MTQLNEATQKFFATRGVEQYYEHRNDEQMILSVFVYPYDSSKKATLQEELRKFLSPYWTVLLRPMEELQGFDVSKKGANAIIKPSPAQKDLFPDMVNKPPHYNRGRIEVIDFIEDQKLTFCRANALKYVVRAGNKDPTKEIEDLEKAIWYLQRDIQGLKREH